MRLISLALLIAGCKKTVASAPIEPPVAPLAAPLPGLDAPLPFLDTVRSGVLPNGMTYFIRKNDVPENRAVFRLALDAGSLFEDDDQRGLAHVVEHMAFNGTENYPGNELISFLESTGTRFGAHLNAHTSFDETVYKLTVPTDNPQSYDAAYTVFRDWACCITFDDAEIEKERGVVLEEWRRRLGAGQRYWDRVAPKYYRGAPHAERMPIGTEESLKSFEPEAVRRFYADWYRPELMALVVVGDIDPDDVEQRIKDAFAGVTGPEESRPHQEFLVDLKHERLFDLSTDPEVTRPSVTVMAKKHHPRESTYGAYREHLLGQVALRVVNERLSERARAEDPPYLRATMNVSRLNPQQTIDRLSVGFDEGNELGALRAAVTEIRRLRVHGVLEGELKRARAGVLKTYSSSLAEDTRAPSDRRANELVRHFLDGESVPGVPAEAALAQRFVPSFGKDVVNDFLANLGRSEAELITVSLVEGSKLPTESQIDAVLAEVEASEIAAPEAGVELDALTDRAPAPGRIVAVDERYEDIGFTGWVLSNGIRVWFKDTGFKEDQVSMRGWIEGGHTAFDDASWNDARSASSMVSWSGVGGHESKTINRFLKDKRAGLTLSMGRYETSFRGNASPLDLAVQLQRLHLSVVEPNFTEKGVGLLRSNWAASVRNRENSPRAQFSDAWTALSWPDDPRRAPTTMDQVDAVTIDGTQAAWTRAVEGVGRSQFGFVGKLPADFEALVTTWLGGLPSTKEGLARIPGTHPRATGDLKQTLHHGVDDKATFRIEYWGERDTLDYPTRIAMSAAGDVLSVLLRERLREEMGGVYGVRVSTSFISYPTQTYRYRIGFTCDPARLEELHQTVLDTIAEVAEEGVDPSYVQAEIAKNREAHEERLENNGFWLGYLESALDRGEDPLQVLRYDVINAALTPARVQEIVGASFDPEHRATLKMLPKTNK